MTPAHTAELPSVSPGLDRRPAATSTSPQRIDSSRLLAGTRELIIEHAGSEYRLRRTQNDKLILTK
jgi:hemin uptake protein HemP